MRKTDSEESDQLIINHKYAEEFDTRNRQKEIAKRDIDGEIARIRKQIQNELSDPETDRDSSESSEDEYGEQIDQTLDSQFYQTLLKIRSRDPSIYDTNAQFYVETTKDLHSDTKAEKKPSKFTVKDSILYSAVDGIQDEETEPMEAKVSTFVEEQQRLKEEFRKVSGEESGEDEDLFALKESRDVEEKEIQVDPAVQAYFDRVEADGDAEETKFLRAYISKELWKTRTNDLNPHPSFSDDEDEIERQDQFEASFNFRFEEPNSNKIVTYPRNVEDSLRKTSSKRSEARRRKQERKKAELEEKLEELKKIKRLKEKNLNEKAKIVQSVAGSSELDFERLLDGDFDPETFDQQMASVFDDKFYQAQDDASEDIIENPLGGIDSRGQEEEEDTSDFVDKKVLLEELRLAKKEFDEALNMDASDLTEDPEQKAVKFNYIPVPATDFGIPTKAILELEDSKLNQMVSLKKLAPYREDRNHISNKTWKELWKDQKQKYKEFKRKHGQLGVSEKNKSKKAKKSN